MIAHNRSTASAARKRGLRTAIAAFVIVALLAGAYAVLVTAGLIKSPFVRQPAPYPTPAADRDGRWQQDVDYLASQLAALHANAFHSLSQPVFQAQVDALRGDISTMDDASILARMAAIAASLGDGHTQALVYQPGLFQLYPLQLRWYADDLVVTAAHPDYVEAVGTRVLQIGNTAVSAAFDAVTPFIAHDNAQQLRSGSQLSLRTPEILAAAGVLTGTGSASYLFEPRDGAPFTLDLVPASVDDASVAWVRYYDVLNIEPPLRTQNPDANYWYTYLADSQAIYFHYFRCDDDPAQPFADFTREMMEFIDANPVRRLIVDLRFNGGGNSEVINPFLDAVRARAALNAPGSLYVLIGAGTFSSAMQNAIDFKTQTNAILLGEPTGGKPNGYGEVRTFVLPNSQLEIQYSTFFFNNMPGYAGDAVMPDIDAAITWDDLLNGLDPAIDAAIAGVGL
jgi:hypothetical protein